MRTYSVYIMASESGVLYTGVTNNLEYRKSQHAQKFVDSFTARYNVHKLVYYEFHGDIRAAIAREKQIKGWLRKKKIALIESMNPHWNDLSADPRKTNPNGKRDSSPQKAGLRTTNAQASRACNPEAISPVIPSAAKNLAERAAAPSFHPEATPGLVCHPEGGDSRPKDLSSTPPSATKET